MVRNASRGHASEGHALPSAEIWSQAELPLGESASQTAYHSPSHTKIRPLLPSARRILRLAFGRPCERPGGNFTQFCSHWPGSLCSSPVQIPALHSFHQAYGFRNPFPSAATPLRPWTRGAGAEELIDPSCLYSNNLVCVTS